MRTHQINKIDIPQSNTELISLLIQYHLEELPQNCMIEIKSKIENCKECKDLYNEIKILHDGSGSLLFEIENPDVMQKHYNQLDNLLITFPANIDLNEEDESDITFYSNHIENNCGCC